MTDSTPRSYRHLKAQDKGAPLEEPEIRTNVPFMNNTPNAWDDEWSSAVDTSTALAEASKVSKKQSKAQKRAAQAEFNKQLWADAQGPQETNYFLESRNVVPLRQEFKPAPVLLSRKGPPVIARPDRPATSTPEADLANLIISDSKDRESSEDEDEEAAKLRKLEQAKIQAAKEREEKQRKYDERRLELFGSSTVQNGTSRPQSQSGDSTPKNLTPPGSRSQTPNRRGKGRGRGGIQQTLPRGQNVHAQAFQPMGSQYAHEVYDPSYSVKPNSMFIARREQGSISGQQEGMPIRQPTMPDSTGRNGAGFTRTKPAPKMS